MQNDNTSKLSQGFVENIYQRIREEAIEEKGQTEIVTDARRARVVAILNLLGLEEKSLSEMSEVELLEMDARIQTYGPNLIEDLAGIGIFPYLPNGVDGGKYTMSLLLRVEPTPTIPLSLQPHKFSEQELFEIKEAMGQGSYMDITDEVVADWQSGIDANLAKDPNFYSKHKAIPPANKIDVTGVHTGTKPNNVLTQHLYIPDDKIPKVTLPNGMSYPDIPDEIGAGWDAIIRAKAKKDEIPDTVSIPNTDDITPEEFVAVAQYVTWKTNPFAPIYRIKEVGMARIKAVHDILLELPTEMFNTLEKKLLNSPDVVNDSATYEEVLALFNELIVPDYDFTELEVVEVREWWINMVRTHLPENSAKEIRETLLTSQVGSPAKSLQLSTVSARIQAQTNKSMRTYTLPNNMDHMETLKAMSLKDTTKPADLPGIINDWFREWMTQAEENTKRHGVREDKNDTYEKRNEVRWEPKVMKHRKENKSSKAFMAQMSFIDDPDFNGENNG